MFQTLSKSVKGFPSGEGPKWGSFIDFDSRLYNPDVIEEILVRISSEYFRRAIVEFPAFPLTCACRP